MQEVLDRADLSERLLAVQHLLHIGAIVPDQPVGIQRLGIFPAGQAVSTVEALRTELFHGVQGHFHPAISPGFPLAHGLEIGLVLL